MRLLSTASLIISVLCMNLLYCREPGKSFCTITYLYQGSKSRLTCHILTIVAFMFDLSGSVSFSRDLQSSQLLV
ncbi:hypothetical protein Y032_0672g1384 [Ancylostoma ceylanicum]|uniref:Secreted protein n=1 Tax=Ancylostoma ceylanicum TaxID=53326 RepID=A0A016WHP9_9BILA|nr:hypothetical protein Y032_0672g1384 [Ancylostoma ceylanicum]